MKTKLHVSVTFVLFLISKLHAQNTECTTIPLNYDTVEFTTAVPASFGDSMITFHITNNHPSQGFAYPLAKLVPLTPLPAGMTAANNNNPWSVFASSWNPGITMPVYYYYDITAPIPLNHTVTFQLWISNLTPVIPDSCYFDSTFTINLNPAPTSVSTVTGKMEWNVIADAAQHSLLISWKKPLQNPVSISVFSAAGKKICEVHAGNGTFEKTINTGKLPGGIYTVVIEGENIKKEVRKIMW